MTVALLVSKSLRSLVKNAVLLGTSEQKQPLEVCSTLDKLLYSVSTAAVSKSLVAAVVDVALSYLYIYRAAWLRVFGFSGKKKKPPCAYRSWCSLCLSSPY